jgi:hypothetical protein
MVRPAGFEPTTPWFVAKFLVIQQYSANTIFLLELIVYKFTRPIKASTMHHNLPRFRTPFGYGFALLNNYWKNCGRLNGKRD